MLRSKASRWAAAPYLVWMVLFIVVPLGIVVWYALTNSDGQVTLANLTSIGRYASVFGRSLLLAAEATIICLVLAFPVGYFLSRLRANKQHIMLMLVMLPMWMNFLLRTYAWRALLDYNGPINQFLAWFGLPPQELLNTEGAVIMGLVYNFLPFMLLPISSVFSKIDQSYIQAAEDLGANKWQVLRKVIFPLTVPGVITGITMVFMPVVTTFVISRLLGGSYYMMFGDLLENQFMLLKDWNTGSALAIIMMILMVLSMAIMRKYDKEGESKTLW